MTAPPSIDLSGWLTEQLGQASPDLLREVITTFVQALMGAEADAVCGAEYGVRSEERTNTRNGHRRRDWETRAGTIELAIPKLRSGSYFPDWLLERRRRAEAALVSVVATSYLLGVSTRRMEKLVSTLGIDRLSKSQVSAMAKDLDGVLGLHVTSAEDGAGWLAFFRDLVARGCPASRWSPPTRTAAWSTPSAPPCPVRPGSAAEPTMPPT